MRPNHWTMAVEDSDDLLSAISVVSKHHDSRVCRIFRCSSIPFTSVHEMIEHDGFEVRQFRMSFEVLVIDEQRQPIHQFLEVLVVDDLFGVFATTGRLCLEQLHLVVEWSDAMVLQQFDIMSQAHQGAGYCSDHPLDWMRRLSACFGRLPFVPARLQAEERDSCWIFPPSSTLSVQFVQERLNCC